MLHVMVTPQPCPCPEVWPYHVGTWPQNPNPARPLPWETGICPFFICKTLQAPAQGLIYIFCGSCAEPQVLGWRGQCHKPEESLWGARPPGVNWGCHQL